MEEKKCHYSLIVVAPRPLLATLGDVLYLILVRLRVCPKTVRTYDVSAPSAIKLTLPGTAPIDAQRRKYVAAFVGDYSLRESQA